MAKTAHHSPGAIWTLQPESCWILLICSPPRPITVTDSKCHVDVRKTGHQKKKNGKEYHKGQGSSAYSPRPTMLSGTRYSSVRVEGLALDKSNQSC